MCAATVFAEISESATTKNRRAILYEEIILSLLSPAAVNVRLLAHQMPRRLKSFVTCLLHGKAIAILGLRAFWLWRVCHEVLAVLPTLKHAT